MKPLNRALSFMNLEETVDDDEPEESTGPACKKPRLADSVAKGLDGTSRVVPPTDCNSLFLTSVPV